MTGDDQIAGTAAGAAGVIALVGTLVTIAVAWVFYRPVLGVILLALAGAGIWFLCRKRSVLKAGVGAALDKAKEIKKKVEENR